MKILVVGGAGYVGGGIVDKLVPNHEVTVYDSLVYETTYRKDVDFIYGDIRDHKKLNSILNNYDSVIWLAALVGDGACSINPSLTQEINAESVKNLTKNYSGRIVFLSTCSVYGAQEGVLSEDSSTNPLSEYASSKLIAEKLDYVGTMCVEYFIDDNENLLVNEIAPRVHNSGHLTINAFNISQFENHIRAVCDLENVQIKKFFNAEMINILGNDIKIYRKKSFKKNEFFFDYLKKEIKDKRKMGHLTILKY